MADSLPKDTTSRPGTEAAFAVTVQGSASGVAIPVTGSLSVSGAADTVGSTAALGAANDTASVALAGTGGCGVHVATGTLVGTLTPELSIDNGTTWIATKFIDTAGAQTATQAIASSALDTALVLIGGARKARVRVSAYTSGTSNAFLIATAGTSAAASGGSSGLTDTQLRASAVPVSVAGVATAANQATEIASLASIDTKLTSPLTVTAGITQVTSTLNGNSGSLTTVGNTVAVSGLSDRAGRVVITLSGTWTGNVAFIFEVLDSGLGLWFPTSALRLSTGDVESTTAAFAAGTTLVWAAQQAGGQFRVRCTTAPASGSADITLSNYSLPTAPVVGVQKLPLPTGAATEATLATRAADRTTAAAPFASRLSDGAAFYDATKTGQLPAALDGSGFLKTHEQGTAAVSAASLPLPAGAATSALQTTGNASLSSIDTKLTNPIPVAAKATAAAPAYTEGTNNAVSQDLAGNLRAVLTGGTTYFPISEIPSGTINGTTGSDGNTVFTLTHTPTDTVRVYVDGFRQTVGVHYTIAGLTITFIAPWIPVSGAQIIVDYTWSMASSTLNSVLVVDASGHVLPTGDAAARAIYVQMDSQVVGVKGYDASQDPAAFTNIAGAPRRPALNAEGLVVRPVDPETPLMIELLQGIHQELIEMRMALDEAFGLDMRQSISKKGGRHYSMTDREKN